MFNLTNGLVEIMGSSFCSNFGSGSNFVSNFGSNFVFNFVSNFVSNFGSANRVFILFLCSSFKMLALAPLLSKSSTNSLSCNFIAADNAVVSLT